MTSFVCQTGIIVLSSQEDKKFSLDKTKCENFHEGKEFCGIFLCFLPGRKIWDKNYVLKKQTFI